MIERMVGMSAAETNYYGIKFRTKRVILEIYDEMTEAMRTGKAYQTRLEPGPADPKVAHPESSRPEWAKELS